MTTPRAETVAAAWADALNAADFGLHPGNAINAEVVYQVTDDLPARVNRAVYVMGRGERGEPLSKGSWLYRIETATAIRVRCGSGRGAVSPAAMLAERIGDHAKAVRPLCLIAGQPVTLESISTTLWLPKDLETAGLFTCVHVHTWRVEVTNPPRVVSSESSDSSESSSSP